MPGIGTFQFPALMRYAQRGGHRSLPLPTVMAKPTHEAGPLDTAILFVDLVSSSEFASVLGLQEYADYLDSFQRTCLTQCRFFFETVHAGKYAEGFDYEIRFIGDELVVYLHAERPGNDVYQLVCLAISLKCAWLACPKNVERVACGMGTVDIACGIHFGTVWATPHLKGLEKRGFAINVAKRIETASREGKHFHIFLSDAAYKKIALLLRNLMAGPRLVLPMKGVLVPIGVCEIEESFVDPYKRLDPVFHEGFQHTAHAALAANSEEGWIHSCLQVWEESRNGCVTDECLDLCLGILKANPHNAVALYYAAQGLVERNHCESARLYLEDLTRYHPVFADGWLSLGRVCKQLGDPVSARHAILQARRHGIPENEEDLP